MFIWNHKGVLSVGSGKKRRLIGRGEEVKGNDLQPARFESFLKKGKIKEALEEETEPSKEVVDNAPDSEGDVKKEADISLLSNKDACNVVKETLDLDCLLKWQIKEERKKVLKTIEKQIEELTEED